MFTSRFRRGARVAATKNGPRSRSAWRRTYSGKAKQPNQPEGPKKTEPESVAEPTLTKAREVAARLMGRRTNLALITAATVGVALLESQQWLDPHMLFVHLDSTIKMVQTGDRQEPVHIKDVLIGQFLTRFLRDNPFAAQHAIESRALDLVIDALMNIALPDERITEPRKFNDPGRKYLQLFPFEALSKIDDQAVTLVEAGLLPISYSSFIHILAQRMLIFNLKPPVEGFTIESRLLKNIVTGPRGAAAVVDTQEFPLLLEALAVESVSRPLTVSYVLYSLIFHEQSRTRLKAQHFKRIESILKEIMEARRVDKSYEYAVEGLRALRHDKPETAMIRPKNIYDFEADHEVTPGILSRFVIALPWGFARWARLASSNGLTAVLWQPWSQLMITKTSETVIGTLFVSSSAYMTNLARKWLGGKVDHNSSNSRVATLASTSLVSTVATLFLLWRTPFVIVPTVLCGIWDSTRSIAKEINAIVDDSMSEYLDREDIRREIEKRQAEIIKEKLAVLPPPTGGSS